MFDVFLSHNSKDKQAVRALADALRDRDLEVWLDEDELRPGLSWQKLMEEGIRASKSGAVLVGKDGIGPWENEEMEALLQLAVRQKKPLIPVLLPGAPKEPDVPIFLSNRTWVDLHSGLTEKGIDKLIWGITGRKPGSMRKRRKRAPEPTADVLVSPTRLRHGAEHLVGRQKELGNLDKAWDDPMMHVVTIVAWGGVGKTALVVDWMARMAKDGWRGAERVFDWSFYSQGTSETTTASSDAFVAKALEFFGDPEMVQSAASPWDKAERLARLIAQRKTLLVLDGVEPLQYPPGPVSGKLKDPALEVLLKGLAQHNAGLCLVTTREPLVDLAPFHDATSPEWSLEHLSEEAGAQLLFQAGVRKAGNAEIKADDQELKDAAREVGGHALTLRLLGNYLKLAHGGDVRKRDIVTLAEADPEFKTSAGGSDESYGRAFKVMATCERWLAGSGEDGKRQLAVLHLLGLFDRPADGGCLAALRKEPAIEGLTEPLVGITEAQWNTTISRLQECGITSGHADDSAPATSHLSPIASHLPLDAHPLVREYFGKQLREKKPDAWREAHQRLYEHLTQNPEHQPDILADLQPLYQAVRHGCLATKYQEALDNVYEKRIQRGTKHFARNRFGSFLSDSAALANFFQPSSFEPVPDLTDRGKSQVLIHTGFYLRVLGRIEEAKQVCQRGLEFSEAVGDWEFAARAAINLAEANLTSGNVASAVTLAHKSVALADKSKDPFLRTYTRANLGSALHQANQLAKSEAAFRHAEALQGKWKPDFPSLYSGYGFLYFDLLFDLGKPEEVKCWVEKTSTPRGKKKHRRWMALDELSLARVAFIHARAQGTRDFAKAKDLLAHAVPEILAYGQEQEKPHALFARASLRFEEGDPQGCKADLDEAWRIAERGSMRLHMADVLLHRARLFRDKAALAEARKLIDECGYHRRDAELADAEEAAKGW